MLLKYSSCNAWALTLTEGIAVSVLLTRLCPALMRRDARMRARAARRVRAMWHHPLALQRQHSNFTASAGRTKIVALLRANVSEARGGAIGEHGTRRAGRGGGESDEASRGAEGAAAVWCAPARPRRMLGEAAPSLLFSVLSLLGAALAYLAQGALELRAARRRAGASPSGRAAAAGLAHIGPCVRCSR